MNSVENQQICSRFVEPEKLANLRTRQEIEVMNGRPWTRELPLRRYCHLMVLWKKSMAELNLFAANIIGSILMQMPTGLTLCRR
jgi:hypothetical protein